MNKASQNEATVNVYSRKIAQYLQNTPNYYTTAHEPLIRWLSVALANVKKQAQIFEFGSGHGRDADYIKRLGYSITCSDASIGFVQHLKKKGHIALTFNALNDSYPTGFDMFLANAVVPHFTVDDFERVLRNVYSSLPKGGIFAFCTKQGDGDVWITEKSIEKRYVHFWQPKDLRRTVEKYGFRIVFFESDIPGGDISTHTWMHVIAQKP